ncbi:hypothetical protein BD408DRAFT_447545 [Parasitella parasitica]|nr:hypothetical protein BD408DRAFT_447545 [Parasitella parasitica]
MVNWNPASMFNNRNNNQDIEIDDNNRSNNVESAPLSSNQSHEQESSHIDQTSHAEPQREPTNVFPSDFGGYILNPEGRSNQSSDLVSGSDDMIAHKDRTATGAVPPPGYATKSQSTHEEDVAFFGDSNTTEPFATSRSTLDQAGLHRGSITTLPSAGNQRRGSTKRRESLNNEGSGSGVQNGVSVSGLGGVHSPESATSTAANVNVPISGSALSTDKKISASLPSSKISSLDQTNKQTDDYATGMNGLSGMASAVASGAAAVASGAAAVLLGTNGQHQSDPSELNDTKMPSAWPDASQKNVSSTQNAGYILPQNPVKKDATNCTHEPSIHGQNPCFYTKDCICEEKEDDTNSHCAHVQEPSIHGQNPSFYCDKQGSCSDARNAIKSCAIMDNDLTRADSINPHPVSTDQGSNFSGIHDSEGIDSDAITAGSCPAGSHRVTDGAAIGAASAIGTGAGIAAFNREPIDADAIRRHSLDKKPIDEDHTGARSDGLGHSEGSNAVPAIELTEPIKRADLGDSTLEEGQVPKTAAPAPVAPQNRHTPMDASSTNNALSDAAVGAGVGTATGGLFGLNRKSSARSNKSTSSHNSTSTGRRSQITTPESNNINAVYQTNAQGVTPERSLSPNDIQDVYRTNAQGVNSDEISDKNYSPTTAVYENDIRDVYRTNAQGATQNMISSGNPTINYRTNDICDVYRTTPRSMTPENSTPRYAESPRLGPSDTHKSIPAVAGTAAAVGGILGSQQHDRSKHTSNDSAVRNNQDNSLHIDPLPLDHTVDQKPLAGAANDNNAHPQQMHTLDGQVPKNPANDALHPQTGSIGPAPIIAGNTETADLPENLQQTPKDRANDTLHPQSGSTGPAPVVAGFVPNQRQNLDTEGLASPIIAGSTGTPVPGNMARSKDSFSSTRAINGSIVPSPAVGTGNNTAASGAAASGGAAAVGSGIAIASRPNEVKDSARDFQNPELKHKSSLTEGIKSAFRRLSVRSDKKSKDGRRMSAAEAFKNQTLTATEKNNSSMPATTAGTANNSTTGSNNVSAVPSHQVQQLQHPNGGFIITNNGNPAATGSARQDYARVPDVHTLKPVGTVNVADNGEVNFIKLNEQPHADAPTKSTLSNGRSEHRRGSIQNTIGKILGNENMQDKGMLSQVSGKEKINAYNAHTHPTNLNNF